MISRQATNANTLMSFTELLAVLVQIEARIGKFLAYRAENFRNIPCSNESEDPIVCEFAIFHSFAIYLSTIHSLNEYLR